MERFPLIPRLLPMTMCALASLLAVRCVVTVRAVAPAFAATAPAAEAATSSGVPPQPAVPRITPAAAPCSTDPAELKLLSNLRARRAQLDKREAELARRESEVQAAGKRLMARVEELAALKGQLEQLEAQRQARDETSWRGLVKVYETMKPRDAAVIFDDLDMQVLSQVADRMREAKLAPVLAAMQPERARALTDELSRIRLKQNAPPGQP